MNDGYDRAMNQAAETAMRVFYNLQEHAEFNRQADVVRAAIINGAMADCAAMCMVESMRENMPQTQPPKNE